MLSWCNEKLSSRRELQLRQPLSERSEMRQIQLEADQGEWPAQWHSLGEEMGKRLRAAERLKKEVKAEGLVRARNWPRACTPSPQV